ncbi:hypothetical protein [Heyndrickxia acidicola]|uniref:Uncharacterized protein n=1 Tax=Heyndrickxia acidicola TaxID=209389 RepID=A0ABU6MBJ8_9BACI|nr:hypothetical protein [Heyndrickxia acidicola]MED1201757.1 hypothetical protein [Heyndrickxia acidicola]
MKTLHVQLQYDEKEEEINAKEKLKNILDGSGFNLVSLSNAGNVVEPSLKNKSQNVHHDEALRRHEQEGVDSDVESSGSGGMVSPN